MNDGGADDVARCICTPSDNGPMVVVGRVANRQKEC